MTGMMRTARALAATACLLAVLPQAGAAVIADTGQNRCYGVYREIACPAKGQPFYGQDAQYHGATPAYRDNGDGTVTDLNTGLMWSKGLSGHKVSPAEAERIARSMTLGGHHDWRVPTIKELYSLIDFRGYTGFSGRIRFSGRRSFSSVPANAVPFINTDYFDFAYGDVSFGERYIDAQWLSSTHYVSTTMQHMDTVFGVNFADGRIKGYGYKPHGINRVVKTFYARYVRGTPYGENDFVDNGNGTVTDRSSGMTWTKRDSGRPMKWEQALGYCEGLHTGGYDDWRLPNAKELQYIVDYTRSPDTTGSPAIDPIFETTAITNEAGQRDYPFFWSSTTHLDGPRPGSDAAYVAFGRALGEKWGRVIDVHGAGAQRGDPKDGTSDIGHGPQGDVRRGKNFVRCARGGSVTPATGGTVTAKGDYPDKVRLVKVEDTTGHRMLGPEARMLQQQGRQSPQGGPGQGGFGQGALGQSGFGQGEPGQGGFRQGGAGQGGAGQGRFVAHLDRDGDNRVSRSEFDGPPDAFDFLDANHDGYLTEDEAPKVPPQGGPSAFQGR